MKSTVRPSNYSILATLLLLTFCGLAGSSLINQSVTTDEVTHIGAGLSYWKTGDFRLNPEHPPFIKLLSTLPLHLSDLAVDTRSSFFQANDQFGFSKELFEEAGADLGGRLSWARLPCLLLAALLGLLIYWWGKSLPDPATGIFALLFFCFSANFLAHSRYVTTDVPAALAIFGSVYFFRAYVRQHSWSRLSCLALCLGLGLLSKFSVIFVLPALAVIGIIEILLCPKENRRLLIQRLLLAAAVSLAVFVVLTLILYRDLHGLQRYFQGMLSVNRNHNPYHEGYLWGSFSPGRRWYYLPAAFLLKTELPLILLGVCFLLRPKTLAITEQYFILVPCLIYLPAVLLLSDNLGIRYLLPIYPFFLLLAGAVAAELWRQKSGKTLLAILLVWLVGGCLSTYPDYLSYFNELIGKRTNGIYYLDDSNIDWGQDNGRVRDWLKTQGKADAKVFWLGFGNLSPKAYGIQAQTPTIVDLTMVTPGIYIVSRHVALRMPSLSWLLYYRGKTALIGDSIIAVHLDGSSRQDILKTFVEAIREHPLDPSLYCNYGIFLAGGGQVKEAYEVLQTAQLLRPDYFQAIFWQGVICLMARKPESAAPLFEKALLIQPENQKARENLALARGLVKDRKDQDGRSASFGSLGNKGSGVAKPAQ